MALFDIYFVDDHHVADLPDCYFGEICVGSFREKFALDSSFWSKERYERQWIEAAQWITTHDRALMITSLCDPATANFIRGWVLYREDDAIFVQEQLCFLDEIDEPFELDAPEKSVGPRETVSEEGNRISEWSTTVEAMKEFLERRTG